MHPIRARLAALLAGLLLTRLVGAGLADASPEVAVALERWVEQSIELVTLLVYSLLERRARERNPPGPDPPRGVPEAPTLEEPRAPAPSRRETCPSSPLGTLPRLREISRQPTTSMQRAPSASPLDSALLVHAIGCVDLGDAFTRGGERERALEYYGTAVDDCLAAGLYDVAAEVCGRMIDEYPDVVRARFTRAFLTLGKGLRESAPDTLLLARQEIAEYVLAASRARQQLRALAQLRLLAGATDRSDVVELIADQMIAIGHPGAADEVRQEFRARRPVGREGRDPRDRWTGILLGAR